MTPNQQADKKLTTESQRSQRRQKTIQRRRKGAREEERLFLFLSFCLLFDLCDSVVNFFSGCCKKMADPPNPSGRSAKVASFVCIHAGLLSRARHRILRAWPTKKTSANDWTAFEMGTNPHPSTLTVPSRVSQAVPGPGGPAAAEVWSYRPIP